jgi:chromosome segregation ATPase
MDNLQRLRTRLECQYPIARHGEDTANTSPAPVMHRLGANGDGGKALDLIYHAAEVLRCIEERANETERRAKNIAEKAIERLEFAEKRIVELEAEKKATEASVAEAYAKIHQTEDALSLERSRLQATEDRMAQIELRAKGAETRARESETALVRIEEAIRTQLLDGRTVPAERATAA